MSTATKKIVSGKKRKKEREIGEEKKTKIRGERRKEEKILKNPKRRIKQKIYRMRREMQKSVRSLESVLVPYK